MKASLFPSLFLCLSGVLPVAAQNFEDRPEAGVPASPSDVPVLTKAHGDPSETSSLIANQDSRTLEPVIASGRKVESVVNLDVLRNPSPFRKVAVAGSAGMVATEVLRGDLARISATYREAGKASVNCSDVYLSIEQRVKLDESELLSIVETELKANPDCACEIVKAAIKAIDAEVSEVLQIVEVSILTAPEQTRMISQCAIASAPAAIAGIQSLLARYDANAGEGGGSAKSAKSPESSKDAKAADIPYVPDVAAMPNPLDFPGKGPVGPPTGGPGGQPLFPPNLPIVITPPVVTEVNP